MSTEVPRDVAHELLTLPVDGVTYRARVDTAGKVWVLVAGTWSNYGRVDLDAPDALDDAVRKATSGVIACVGGAIVGGPLAEAWMAQPSTDPVPYPVQHVMGMPVEEGFAVLAAARRVRALRTADDLDSLIPAEEIGRRPALDSVTDPAAFTRPLTDHTGTDDGEITECICSAGNAPCVWCTSEAERHRAHGCDDPETCDYEAWIATIPVLDTTSAEIAALLDTEMGR